MAESILNDIGDDDYKVLRIIKENEPASSRDIKYMVNINVSKLYKILKRLSIFYFIRRIKVEDIKEKYPECYEKWEKINHWRSKIKIYYELTPDGVKKIKKLKRNHL